MAAALQGHQVHPEGRVWKSHFPKGDLWVFGYGYVFIKRIISLLLPIIPRYRVIAITNIQTGYVNPNTIDLLP